MTRPIPSRRQLLTGAAVGGVALMGTVAAAGPAAAVDGTPYLDLTSAVPRRVFDSRSTDAAHGGGRIHGGQTRTISVDIEAGPVNPGIFVAMTLTIVNTAGGGFLSVYPASLTSRPGISSINWSAPDQVYATGLMTRTEIRTSLEEPARESFVKVYCGGGSTHFLLDLTAVVPIGLRY